MADDALAPSAADHQQPQRWLCRILNRSLSSKKNGFNYWCHLIVGKWQKMWKYFCFSSNRYSTSREDDHFNLIVECKTAVSPLPMQWRYCSLALSHQTVLSLHNFVYPGCYTSFSRALPYKTYQEYLVCTLAEHTVVFRRVHWSLFGELGVKLTHILLTRLKDRPKIILTLHVLNFSDET